MTTFTLTPHARHGPEGRHGLPEAKKIREPPSQEYHERHCDRSHPSARHRFPLANPCSPPFEDGPAGPLSSPSSARRSSFRVASAAGNTRQFITTRIIVSLNPPIYHNDDEPGVRTRHGPAEGAFHITLILMAPALELAAPAGGNPSRPGSRRSPERRALLRSTVPFHAGAWAEPCSACPPWSRAPG